VISTSLTCWAEQIIGVTTMGQNVIQFSLTGNSTGAGKSVGADSDPPRTLISCPNFTLRPRSSLFLPLNKDPIPFKDFDCLILAPFLRMAESPSAVGLRKRACINCTTGKAKCTPYSSSICERCHRLKKNCTYDNVSTAPRKPKANL
jgi:hypothetical protein